MANTVEHLEGVVRVVSRVEGDGGMDAACLSVAVEDVGDENGVELA